MKENNGAFRFTYFTDKYDETHSFYESKLGFQLMHSWDRNEHAKGAAFKAEAGLIEILHRPIDEENRYPALEYRVPPGVFMGIQIWNIDALFKNYKTIGVPFKQETMDQP